MSLISQVCDPWRAYQACETSADAPQVLQKLLEVDGERISGELILGKFVPEKCADGLKDVAYLRINGEKLLEKQGDEKGIIRGYKALKKFEWSLLWRGELLGQVLRVNIYANHLSHAQKHFGLTPIAVTGPQADLRVQGREVEYSLTQIFKGISHGSSEPPHLIVRRVIRFEIPEGPLALNIPKNPKIEDSISPEFPSLEKTQDFFNQHLLQGPL